MDRRESQSWRREFQPWKGDRVKYCECGTKASLLGVVACDNGEGHWQCVFCLALKEAGHGRQELWRCAVPRCAGWVPDGRRRMEENLVKAVRGTHESLQTHTYHRIVPTREEGERWRRIIGFSNDRRRGMESGLPFKELYDVVAQDWEEVKERLETMEALKKSVYLQ